MNATERRYADHLNKKVMDGKVVWWAFESIKLKVAGNSFYKPDFIVQMHDGTIELHEVKGWMTEAARLRVKAAAERYPFRFVLVRPVKGGGWNEEVYGEATAGEPADGAGSDDL